MTDTNRETRNSKRVAQGKLGIQDTSYKSYINIWHEKDQEF